MHRLSPPCHSSVVGFSTGDDGWSTRHVTNPGESFPAFFWREIDVWFCQGQNAMPVPSCVLVEPCSLHRATTASPYWQQHVSHEAGVMPGWEPWARWVSHIRVVFFSPPSADAVCVCGLGLREHIYGGYEDATPHCRGVMYCYLSVAYI